MRRDGAPAGPRWSPSAATAAASCSRIPTSTSCSCCRGARRRRHRASSRSSACSGTSGSRSATACARRRLRPRDGRRRDDPHEPARAPPDRGQPPALRGVRPRVPRRDGRARRSTRPRRWSSSSATSSTTTRPTTSSRTSRRARAACATCRPSSGSRAPRGWAAAGTSSPQAGLITQEEARDVTRQERFLATIRMRLHYLAGRREDRLVFDQQTALAGSSASSTRRPGAPPSS